MKHKENDELRLLMKYEQRLAKGLYVPTDKYFQLKEKFD